jgi:hypothetical protein
MIRRFRFVAILLLLAAGCSTSRNGDTINVNIVQTSYVDLVTFNPNPLCGLGSEWNSVRGGVFSLVAPPAGIAVEENTTGVSIGQLLLTVAQSVPPTIYQIGYNYSFADESGLSTSSVVCSGTIALTVVDLGQTY